jgi:hypothetical protein
VDTLLLLVLVGFALYVYLRRADHDVDPRLSLEHWSIVSDGIHNSNTDMIEWQGELLLVHAASPWHLASTRSRLLVKRSRDGRAWETLATLRVPGHDIRDPKLAVVGGRLFLYALPNHGITATPTHTVLATSDDGRSWSGFEKVGPKGWLFWRPKSPDGGKTWYVPAYWHDHGESILLRSEDGLRWEQVSCIHEGDGNDETAIEFLADGRLLATARLEITPDRILGNPDACTLLAVAAPPYETWQTTRSRVTRLDGPVLFTHAGTVFAVARNQVGPRGPLTSLGGLLSRKRTAIFRVEPDRLVHLSDLPSSGDTSYAGVVLQDGVGFIDYYTSRIDRDWPWLLALFLPTEIRMARISLDGLAALSDATAG